MPRNRKPKDAATPDEPNTKDEEESGDRPSQLDAIRAALAETPSSKSDEPAELPAPEEEPELPAHVEVPAAEAAEAVEATTEPAAEAEEPPAETTPAEQEEPAEPEKPAAEVVSPAPTSEWVPPPSHPPAAAAAFRSFTPSSSLALGVV